MFVTELNVSFVPELKAIAPEEFIVPTNCLLKTKDVSEAPLLASVNKVFVFLFCNFLKSKFFSWSAKVALALFAGTEVTLFDSPIIAATLAVVSGVVGSPKTGYFTVVSVTYVILNLPLYLTSLWSFTTTVLEVPVPARTIPVAELKVLRLPTLLVKVACSILSIVDLVVAAVERIENPSIT